MKKSLDSIATQSDKISHHGYHRFYDRFLSDLAEKNDIKMLELGYENGYSINLWKDYFKNVTIHSIDIIEDPKNNLVSRYFKVDQDSNEQLDKFVSNSEIQYDFIIDDASHVPTHQWNTFIKFIKILKDGGIYIIEDTETSFWRESEIFGYKFNSSNSSLFDKIPNVVASINKEFIDEKHIKQQSLSNEEINAIDLIESITIGYNCIIFTKKSKELSKYYRENKDYRHNVFIDMNKEEEQVLQKKGFLSKVFKK